MVAHSICEGLAVGAGATWITVEHTVAMCSQYLKLMKEGVAIVGVRTAMDVDDQGITLALDETGWLHDPSLDIPPVGTPKLDMARWAGHIASEDRVDSV